MKLKTVFIAEIDDGWANLFQCNTSTSLWTCNHDYTSAGIVCNGYGVGTYDGYISANVTAAQVGITNDQISSNASECVNSTSSQSHISSTRNYSTVTITACASSSPEDHSLLVLGVGLGAGLGLPLLVMTSLMVYYANSNRKQTRRLQAALSASSRTEGQTSESNWPANSKPGRQSYPVELGSPMTVHNELEDTYVSKTRSDR